MNIDPKGLYKKAFKGEITHITGSDSPFEQPLNPELINSTQNKLPELCAKEIFNYLVEKGLITINVH